MELIAVSSDQFPAAAQDTFARALATLERPVIAFPTGRTPLPLYQEMARTTFALPAGTRAFALDEYVTACADAPGSNVSFMRRSWPAHLPPVALPRADAVDPAGEIAAYCRAIVDCGGLDVAVIGIGGNGHIAFNEPGSARDASCRVVALAEETRQAAAADWPDGAPTWGMTLGVREIMAARRVILLATGTTKAMVLRAALTGSVSAALPASYLQEHPSLIVVCDTAAWPD